MDPPLPPTEAPPAQLPIPQDRLESVINKKLGTSAKLLSTDCKIIGEGKGFLSVITKAELTWAPESSAIKSLPKCVILKKPTMDKILQVKVMSDMFQDPGLLAKLHNRECDAYAYFTKYAPAPVPLARCFTAEKITEEPGSGVLVLEYMSNSRSLHFNEDAGIDRIMTVIGYIAALQAYGYEHPEHAELLGEMPINWFQSMSSTTVESARQLREKYPGKFKMTDDDVTKLMAEAEELSDTVMNPQANGFSPVLCFGDVQPNNVLWKVNSDDTLSAEPAAFLDFQIAHTGGCCFDIGMLVGMNVDPKVWEANEDKVFRHYLDVLKSKTSKHVPITMVEAKKQFQLLKKLWGIGGIAMVESMGKFAEMAGITPARMDQMVDRLLSGLEAPSSS